MDKVTTLLEKGEAGFLEAAKKRSITLNNNERFSTAIAIIPQIKNILTEETFLNTLLYSRSNLTGWPFWRDSRKNPNDQNRPKMDSKQKWHCFEIGETHNNTFQKSLSFWSIENSGLFYQERQLRGDFYEDEQPFLSPKLIAIRAAEVIAIGLSFAKALRADEEAYLDFAFRWTGLKGKKLQLMFGVPTDSSSTQDTYESFLRVPVIASSFSIPEYVYEATRGLFRLFHNGDMREIIKKNVEDILKNKF